MSETPNRGYPLPDPTNKISDDVLRLIAAFEALDADVAQILLALAAKAAAVHNHAISDVQGLESALAGKASSTHTHGLDDLSDVSGANGASAGSVLVRTTEGWAPGNPAAILGPHEHTIEQIQGLQTVLAKIDAATLDGLEASDFLRNDDVTTFARSLLSAVDAPTAGDRVLGSTNRIELGNSLTGDRPAYLDFHADDINTDRSARIVRNPGVNGTLDLINQGTGAVCVNGQAIWHAGNLTPSATAVADTVALRDSSGDIRARLLRSEYSSTNASVNFIMTQIETGTGNNFIRPSTPAQVATALASAGLVPTSRTVTAGTGLDGGGALSANLSFSVDSTVWRDGNPPTEGAGISISGGSISVSSDVWRDGNPPSASQLTSILGEVAGFYTGSSSSATSFPVGHLVLADYGSPVLANASATVYTSSGRYGSVPGSALSGTWRSRGTIETGGSSSRTIVLFQRTA